MYGTVNYKLTLYHMQNGVQKSRKVHCSVLKYGHVVPSLLLIMNVFTHGICFCCLSVCFIYDLLALPKVASHEENVL